MRHQIARVPHAELMKRAPDGNSGILVRLTLNNRVDRPRGSGSCKGLGGKELGRETESFVYEAGENSASHWSMIRDESND